MELPRLNFIVSALGSINPSEFGKASKTIETDLIPYIIDDLNEKVGTAASAVKDGVWSRREGVMFAGNADRIDEELKKNEEKQATKNAKIRKKNRKWLLSQKIAELISLWVAVIR